MASGNERKAKESFWKCPKCDHINRLEEEGYSWWRCKYCGVLRPLFLYEVTGIIVVIAIITFFLISKSYDPLTPYKKQLLVMVEDLKIDGKEKNNIQLLQKRYRLSDELWKKAHVEVFGEVLRKECRTINIDNAKKEAIHILAADLVIESEVADQLIRDICLVDLPRSPFPESSVTLTPNVRTLVDFIEQGDYAKAQTEMEEMLKTYPESKELKEIRQQLTEEMPIDITFEYRLKDNPTYVSFPISASLMTLGNSLTHEDYYRFKISPSRVCYLYIYQEDSERHLELLFPNPIYNQPENPLPIGTYQIPSQTKKEEMGRDVAFYLEVGNMTERIFIIASSFAAKDLEENYKNVKGSLQAEQLSENLKKFNADIDRRRNVNLKGVYFRELRFDHVEERDETSTETLSTKSV